MVPKAYDAMEDCSFLRRSHNFRSVLVSISHMKLTSVEGAFSGLLAYGISFMDGIRGLEGWSWIFVGVRSLDYECCSPFTDY